jgi:thermostable 8-oxoguanine DNA glycosylase
MRAGTHTLKGAHCNIQRMTTDQNLQAAQDRLLKSIRMIYKEKKNVIQELKKCEKELKRNDFIWFYLLQSFGTMGGAARATGLMARYQDIRYEVLLNLTRTKRQQKVQTICRETQVRFPDRKTEYILGCFDLIEKMGGPVAAKQQLLKQVGRDKKIEFLRQFPGIGPKYARNIMMDVYHPEFRDCIAIDARITSISRCLSLEFTATQYLEHEKFYLKVAKKAKLDGWELDRLLFNFNNEIEQSLDCSANRQTRKEKSAVCH